MAMKNRVLGRTGVSVSPLCLGAMMFGPWGNKDEADSIRIIHRALDAGVNFVDTADVYSGGESERIVGKALAGRRDDVVLATKFFMPMDGGDPNQRGGSRRWIIREVENSLRRLDTDYIDLYQVHRPSQDTDVEETLGALTDLIRQGKVRYIGSSSYSASQIVEAQWTARDRRLERFVTEQPPYSILVRGVEADVLPTARRHGMGILSYSPLGGGWLSGRWRKDAASAPTSAARPSARFDMASPANQRKLDVVEELAARRQGGPDAHRAGHRVRHQPPRRHRRDHRPAHHAAARVAAARRRGDADRRHPRPDRPTRRPRGDDEPRRQQLRRGGTDPGSATTRRVRPLSPTSSFAARRFACAISRDISERAVMTDVLVRDVPDAETFADLADPDVMSRAWQRPTG